MASSIATGPLFRPISKGDHIASTRLTDQSVALIIKHHAATVGLRDKDLSGHSLRAGLATSAAQEGISLHKIRAQTGHTSEMMLERYIRDGQLFSGNAASVF